MFVYSRTLLMLTTLVALQSTITWITALPQGAPETVCDTMLPFHGGGIAPQRSLEPFRIETSSPIVGQGQTLRLQILAVPADLTFSGFMLQARNQDAPYQIIGQFNTNDERVKLMNCANSVNNSVTHSQVRPLRDLSLEWQSPVNFLGRIAFNATVAQEYSSFWVGIPSNIVQIVKRDVATPFSISPTTTRNYGTTRQPFVPVFQQPGPPAPVEDAFYTDCGVSKTCFGMPDGCINDKSCTALGAVKVRGDIYEFEMRSGRDNPAYIALGLSRDTKMGADLVTECVRENGRVAAYTSYTTGVPNYGTSRNGVPQNTARMVESSLVDGVIYCKVQRDALTTVQGDMFDLINSKYNLLLASGRSLKENGAGFHDIGRLAADKAINLAEVQSLAGASMILVRLHGAFMVVAWIGTASLGIILARYFKQTWVGHQIIGKDYWFAFHTTCMITTWILTVVAVILIFILIGPGSQERNPHDIIGFIVTVLCFAQPIGAFFRPAPNSKNRPYFNWVHWFGGNVAHILSIVAIFFAVSLTKAQLPEWMDWILVAFVVFHVIVHMIFSVVLCMQIAGCSSDRQQSQRVNTFQMGDMGHHHHGMRNGMKAERKMNAPYAAFRKGLLAVYCVVLALFLITLVLCIVLAPIEQTIQQWQAKTGN